MWKIQLHKPTRFGPVQQVVVEHEWREDFIGEALTIYLDRKACFTRMDFYSSDFGCTRWIAQSGVHLPQLWCANNTGDGESMSYFGEDVRSLEGKYSGNRLITETILRKLPYGHLEKAIRRALLNPQKKVVLPEVFFGGLIGAVA